MNDRPTTGNRFYGSADWTRLPTWRRFLARWWFVIVLALWVLLFAACAGDGRPDAIEPRQDVEVHVTNSNWLDVNVYTWINDQRWRLGSVITGNDETFTLSRSLADHPDLRFLIDPIGSSVTHLTERILVGTGRVIEISIANSLPLTTVIVRE